MRTILNAVDLPALLRRLESPSPTLAAALLELLGSERYAPAVEALLRGDTGRDDAPEIFDALVGVVGYQPLSVDLPTAELEALVAAPPPLGPALERLLANRGPRGEELRGAMRVGFFAREGLPGLRADCEPGSGEPGRELLLEDILPALDELLANGRDLYVRSM